MEYRHQVISGGVKPYRSTLPQWFVASYEALIDFDREYWASYGECKRHDLLEYFDKDVQAMLIEIDFPRAIQLVYFADEGHLICPDIIHATITQEKITGLRMVPDNEEFGMGEK